MVAYHETMNLYLVQKNLTEKYYCIKANPRTSVNPTSNVAMERIHQVLGNLVWTYNITETYVDEYYLWLGILAAA